MCAGTIPPIKSPLEKNDDVKKLFSIGCPVILVTLGVALLFIIRKKRKEKRLKRLRGERRSKSTGDKLCKYVGQKNKAVHRDSFILKTDLFVGKIICALYCL